MSINVNFRAGSAAMPWLDGGKFDVAHLPDSEKERLCRDLLAEFGITHIREGGNGELIHACNLPFSNHTDQDRNPTASLNFRKLAYSCLGSCQSGGGLLWFIATMRGDHTSNDARKWLEARTGTGDDDESLSALLAYFEAVYDPSRSEDAPMPHMDASVLSQWSGVHPYLTDIRGIPEGNITDMQVGHGYLRVRTNDGEFVESPRIVIPHFWQGTLVGWQSRRIIDDGTPKYLSTPDMPKDRTIYNYDPKARSAVVVESPMSVLSKRHLPHHIEATFGAKVTERQLRLIARHPRVVLFMDNDEAGWGSTREMAEYLEAYSSVWVADNSYAADAGDLPEDEYLRAVDDAVPYAVWTPPARVEVWGE